ncbi:MAG: signal recognition particle-docking protein FtsY [Parachlamydiaceae bacterium]
MIFKLLKSGYDNVKKALLKTGSVIGKKLRKLFETPVDEAVLEKLEELLYEADLGAEYARELTDNVRQLLRKNPKMTGDALIDYLRTTILAQLNSHLNASIDTSQATPFVILVVGVNGNGKTTSLAKLAHLFQQAGKKVLIGAADTFRAAAIEQLETWAQRLHVDIVKGNSKSDPAAVAFDTVSAAKARHVDVVLIDTAGRLHTKTPLMQELEKIRRACHKVSPHAPHETLLVLDATAGQNAIEQASVFHKHTPISGLILTKLDGTAKGGIAIAIQKKLKIPIKYIGVGEGVDDLQPFKAKEFVDAIFD